MAAHVPYASRIGERFGRLVLLELVKFKLPSGKSHVKGRFKCDCGNEKVIFLNSVLQGNTTSCKCDKSRYRKMSGIGHYKFSGHQGIRASVWSGFQASAAARSLPFELRIEDAWSLYEAQERKCALSGVEITFEPGKLSRSTASLDRIDNALGYVPGNVQWVHKRVNLMRNTLTIEEFFDWCGKITRHASRDPQ